MRFSKHGRAALAAAVWAVVAVAHAQKAAPKAPDDPAERARRAQAVATYNGGQVTVGDLEDAIAQQSAFMRARYRDPQNLRELLDRTLRFSLLADEAERRGLDKASFVQQTIKQNAVEHLIQSDFDAKLDPKSIPKQELEAYYKAHIDEYVQPELRRASQIVAPSEQEARDLLASAKDMDVRAFRDLARGKSRDEATRMRGGDLRYFDAQGKTRGAPEDVLPAAVVHAAFALKDVGDTAPKPIKVDGGYAVVKLTGVRPALSRKLGDVEETIRVRLWRDQREKAIEALVAKLRAEVKPEVHPELVDAIKLDDMPLGSAALGPQPGALPAQR